MKSRIKELREAEGWSQGALGEKVGVSRQAINAVERGKHIPTLQLAFKFAKTFGLRIEEIFTPQED